MKIRFNQPKYVLPIIVLPFLIGIFYVVNDTFAQSPKDTGAIAMEEIEAINPSLPAANLDKKELKDKFESFKDAFKTKRDYSAMRDLEIDERADSLKNESKYTAEEKALIDSINASIIDGTNKDFSTQVQERVNRQSRPVSSPSSQRVARKEPSKNKSSGKKETSEEREMRLFKEQMLMLDSLTKTPEQREAERLAAIQEKKMEEERERLKAEKERQVPVTKTNTILGSHFNTITKENTNLFISAILDEGLKVVDGSRIRIRLMDDIQAGGWLVEKGTYIYGIITSFSEQRIYITINSIMVDNQILPVELVVYDTDGMEGLYVPESKFRDFQKDMATNVTQGSRIRMEQSPNNAAQFFYNAAERAMTATTKAAGKAARRNRAYLKYNTIIYLVNPEELKK